MREDATGRLRTIVARATIAFFVVEWLLFELIRIPYAPPRDMLTFLGQEKYFVVEFLSALAVAWFWVAVYFAVCYRFATEDYRRFAILNLILILGIGALVLFPPWTVTPFDLLLK